MNRDLYQPFCARKLSWVYRELCSCLPGWQRPGKRRSFPSCRQASFIRNIPQKPQQITVHWYMKKGRCVSANVPSNTLDPEICTKLQSVRATRSSCCCKERVRSVSVGLSACGLYLYLELHANGSCETSQTFFPTVTFHQSGRGTRGPREDGSWSAPSHWLFGRWCWRPMARGPGSGHSRGNFSLQSSIIVAFTY